VTPAVSRPPDAGLSAAAIATSFLGGQVLIDHDPRLWTWLAIASFMWVVNLVVVT
jgi:hypothetical protein